MAASKFGSAGEKTWPSTFLCRQRNFTPHVGRAASRSIMIIRVVALPGSHKTDCNKPGIKGRYLHQLPNIGGISILPVFGNVEYNDSKYLFTWLARLQIDSQSLLPTSTAQNNSSGP